MTFQHVACQKSFCVAGAMLWLRFQKMRCIFRGSCSTLETSHVILRGRRSSLDVSYCVFFANLIVSIARSGDKVQIPWRKFRGRRGILYKIFTLSSTHCFKIFILCSEVTKLQKQSITCSFFSYPSRYPPSGFLLHLLIDF